MASAPQPAALPAAVQVTRFWSANRRLMLLASLATGLALVFIWLRGEARSGLLAALLAVLLHLLSQLRVDGRLELAGDVVGHLVDTTEGYLPSFDIARQRGRVY